MNSRLKCQRTKQSEQHQLITFCTLNKTFAKYLLVHSFVHISIGISISSPQSIWQVRKHIVAQFSWNYNSTNTAPYPHIEPVCSSSCLSFNASSQIIYEILMRNCNGTLFKWAELLYGWETRWGKSQMIGSKRNSPLNNVRLSIGINGNIDISASIIYVCSTVERFGFMSFCYLFGFVNVG